MQSTQSANKLAIVLLCMFLQGCANSLGAQLAAVAVTEPFLRRSTGNICSDSPAQAYASGGSQCGYIASPIDSVNVNSPWLSANGYCFLEWALVYDRADLVEEAITKGADPFKCDPRGFPLFTALRQLEGKHGAQRKLHYLGRLKEAKVLGTSSGAKFIRFGIENREVELIRYGLDLGHPIDAPVNVRYNYGKFNDIFAGKSALYVASLKFLISNTYLSAAPVEFLMQQGARIDPSIFAYIDKNAGQLNRGSIEQLKTLLYAQSTGSR